MTVPVVPFGVTKSQAMAMLMASRTSYGTLDATEKRWKDGEIDDAIIDADVEFQRAICETDKHPRRIMFYQAPVSVTFGANLPAHIGPFGPVQVTYANGELWPGFRAPAEWIRTWRNDYTPRIGTGGITIGQSEITRATGWRFTQSDVGKTITIQDAGPASGPLSGVITRVDNYGQIAGISASATATVTGKATAWAGNDSFGGYEAAEGAWDIVENAAYFIGTALNVTLCEIARGTNNPTTGLKSPLECINGVKGMALGTLFAKDSMHMDAAGYYAGYANMCLGLIREGKMTFPPLMQFEPGRTD